MFYWRFLIIFIALELSFGFVIFFFKFSFVSVLWLRCGYNEWFIILSFVTLFMIMMILLQFYLGQKDKMQYPIPWQVPLPVSLDDI